jgi:hypothetical protein
MDTGLISKWLLIYDGTTFIAKQHNDNQTTTSPFTIEQFDTEAELDARAAVLGVTIPVEGE